MREAAIEIDKFGAKFGFSPADRARIKVESQEKDELEEFQKKNRRVK
jgi:phage terminase small subunit